MCHRRLSKIVLKNLVSTVNVKGEKEINEGESESMKQVKETVDTEMKR